MTTHDADPTVPKRVMVVDDDLGVRIAVMMALQSVCLDIEEATDGLSALTLLQTKPFDALLIDVQMPGMTGLELAASVREVKGTLPMALMTGAPSSVSPQARSEVGINQLFIKPFDLDDVQRWLHEVLAVPT